MPEGSATGDEEFVSHTHAAESIARQIGLEAFEGDVTVVGFSLGGQVAVELATRFPNAVTRTVIVSSLLRPWRLAGLYVRAAIAVAPGARSEEVAREQAKQQYLADEHFEEYLALSSSMSKRSRGNIIRSNFSFAPATSFLQSDRPVLVMAGAQEQRRLIADSEKLSATLPRAQFVLVDDVGHGASLARPGHFNEVIGRFLAHDLS
ncbi:alpha/beta hydrolase family protein [Glaciihabitans tibetensis]|uniref:Alpha/beta hydrolase family protein n=1 Tax=Glaciihabitans tibetensis TaxID=1266600 RepID=A0A2T0VE75_9MICO|nr:alpha/beta hydrolase [Glaciihabitans tibetensis]PRY68481.1 alpha/beta hydrolase family protein [Glaciihabitans tibetensis]